MLSSSTHWLLRSSAKKMVREAVGALRSSGVSKAKAQLGFFFRSLGLCLLPWECRLALGVSDAVDSTPVAAAAPNHFGPGAAAGSGATNAATGAQVLTPRSGVALEGAAASAHPPPCLHPPHQQQALHKMPASQWPCPAGLSTWSSARRAPRTSFPWGSAGRGQCCVQRSTSRSSSSTFWGHGCCAARRAQRQGPAGQGGTAAGRLGMPLRQRCGCLAA